MTAAEIKQKESQYVMHTYGRFDIVFDHGEGATLYDADGKPYVDMTAGIGVTSPKKSPIFTVLPSGSRTIGRSTAPLRRNSTRRTACGKWSACSGTPPLWANRRNERENILLQRSRQR